MKSIRFTLLIILGAVLIFISSQIDQTIPFFSKANLSLLFSILVGGLLAIAVLYLTEKMEGIDKKQYPQKSHFIWLYIFFGWICISLVIIAVDGSESVIGYSLLITFVSLSYLTILNTREQIRKKMNDDKQASDEVEKGD